MAYLALSPVSAAVYAKLNVAGMTALVGSRIYDDVPRAAVFPFVWIEVRERDVRGFGTGAIPEVELWVHAFSTYQGMKEAQSICQKAVELLRDQALTISGYTQAGLVFYDDTTPLQDQAIEGVKVQELVSKFRIYARES